MPRTARANTDGNFFHVMVQGIGREYVFVDDRFKGFYLSCLKNAKKKSPTVKVFGFCVMDNHAHILVGVKSATELSTFFRRVNSAYASYYNRNNDRVGYVFRDRFKSESILSSRQLIYCLAYIHNNPLKAGIVANAEAYPYSSYTNYATRKGIVDFDEAEEYYDTSIDSIRAIMSERTNTEWLEQEEGIVLEDFGDVFNELKEKYGFEERKIGIDKAALVTEEMQKRCGASIKEMARLLGVGRENLRKHVRK